MKCTQAEKLIPLFAGDDLPAREANVLRQHLESCADCRRLASEFEESRDWLINLAAPQFDEAMLDGLRDGVLREISRVEKRRRWFDQWFGWIVPNWNPRFAFAVSLAALLLIAAFGLLIYRRQPPHGPKQDRADVRKDAGDQVGSHPGGTQDEPDPQIVKGNPEQRRIKRKATRRGFAESPQPEAQTAEPDFVAQDIEPPDPAKPDPIKIDLAANREMTRIEFQTADPNIRIIWLTPKDSSLNKPNTNIR
jgi:hypothetical protein